MPELPEVETVRRGLNNLTLDLPIQSGEVLLTRSLAYPADVEQFGRELRVKRSLAGREGENIYSPSYHQDNLLDGWEFTFA